MRSVLLLNLLCTALAANGELLRAQSNSRTGTAAPVVVLESTPSSTAPTLRLAAAARVVVGGPEDDESVEIDHRLGDMSAALLPDGGIAVGDRTRVHLFARDGTRRTIVGRSGDGPGEFRYNNRVCVLPGDTVAVWDLHNKRVGLIAPTGKFARHLRQDRAVSVNEAPCSPAGLLLTRTTTGKGPRMTREAVLVQATRGGSPKQIAEFSRLSSRVTLAAPYSVLALGNELAYADPDRGEIYVFDQAGKPQRTLRWSTPRQAIADAAYSRLVDWALRGFNPPDAREWVKSRELAGDRPTSYPAFHRVLADPKGNLWVEDARLEDQPKYTGYTGFDANGKRVGRFLIDNHQEPRMGRRVLQIGNNEVLLLRRDEDRFATIEAIPLVPIR